MNIPTALQQAIDILVKGMDSNKMREDVTNISNRYIYESGKGKSLVKSSDEVIAYAVSRMPATYCSVYTVLKHMCELYDGQIKTLLDLGAGTGAVSWAAEDIFLLDSFTCVEREKSMIEIAQKLMTSAGKPLQNAKWHQADVISELKIGKYDFVTASYVMNELRNNTKSTFLDNLWNNSSNVIMIIEPGTQVGYNNILTAREYLIKKGASVIAPCTHNGICGLEEEDWCHFSCRLQRNKLEKYVKKGDAPFEDEKFSYIIVSKNKVNNMNLKRIIRHPIIDKGYINLKICSADGIRDDKITSKNTAAYKFAKKAKWDDILTEA